MYNVFYMSLQEQNTIRKEWINNLVELKLELDAQVDKKYKVKMIKDNAIYTKAA